jgi:hypothetical protein
LGRPFLRTIGAIIDMREGTIKYQFPLKKGMEHWYVANVSIIFDAPCLFYTNCYMFCLRFVILLWFIWTNLLIVAKVHNVLVLHFDV